MVKILRKVRSRRVTAVIVAAAVMVAALGAWGLLRWQPWASKSSRQTVAAGVTVVLPAGGHVSDYGLSAGPAFVPKAVASRQGMVQVRPPLEFRSTRRIPPGTQLRFQVAKNLKPPAPKMSLPVFVAYYDTLAHRWVPEPSTYNPRTGVVVATVQHFSVHTVLEWSRDQVEHLLMGALKSVFGPWLDHVTPPQCGAQHGVSMTLMQGDDKSMLACHEAAVVSQPTVADLGSANITVRLGNSRHYPVDVISPKNSVVHTGNPGDPAWQLGAAITKAVSLDTGKRMALLPAKSLMSVQFPTTPAPFDSVRERSQIDGTAYFTGLLVTALDELGKMCGLDIDQTVPTLVKELDTAQLTVESFQALEDFNLSGKDVEALGKLAMDALLTSVEHGPLVVIDGVKLALSIVDAGWQDLTALVDTVEGNAFHLWTFGTKGTIWGPPLSSIQQTDWGNVTIPGDWFGGPTQVRLKNGEWQGLTSHGSLDVRASIASGQVRYGDLFGNGQDVAALEVWVENNPGGTAAAQVAQGWLVFQKSPSGLKLVGEVLPRVAPINAWSANPRNASHVSFIASVSIVPGAVKCQEYYYRPDDSDAAPSGRGHYAYAWVNGLLMTPPDVFPFPH